MGHCASSSLAGLAALAALAAALAVPALAHADVQHTVGRGHTIEAIANRYHVSAKSILEANHLKDVKHLRVGEVLTIPGVKDRAEGGAKAKADEHGTAGKKADEHAATKKADKADKTDGTTGKKADAHDEHGTAAKKADKTDAHDGTTGKKGEKTAKVGKTTGRETTTFAMKAKTPGIIHVHRIATTEQFDIHVGDKRGRVSPVALKTFEKMMRSPAGMAHPIDGRLVSLLGIVSNHFGSRKIEVVSGFRPFTPTQFNPHSNHMHGKAIDFRVAGVPNETLRDFCRTLKNVGCGYYPNSVFVHMDVREASAFWIDYSKPGEAPRYNAPNTEADEGTSDVQDTQPAASATSNTAPAEAAEAAAPESAPAPRGDTGDN